MHRRDSCVLALAVLIPFVTPGPDPESKVETLSTCKRGAVKNILSAKSTLDLSATLRGVALDSVSSTE
jgi:hypothetical protein